jgi:hypothetical protein
VTAYSVEPRKTGTPVFLAENMRLACGTNPFGVVQSCSPNTTISDNPGKPRMAEGAGKTLSSIDLQRLFKLRLVVARFGEKDNAGWWKTERLLGSLGTSVLRRGFPRTFRFAQARAVFAVAGLRCRETYDPPNSVTLWKLPAELEDLFASRWAAWLDEGDQWGPFFAELEEQGGTDLLGRLRRFELLSAAEAGQAGRLRRMAENKAVPLPSVVAVDDTILGLLAAGFHRGEPGNLAVPFAKLEVEE